MSAIIEGLKTYDQKLFYVVNNKRNRYLDLALPKITNMAGAFLTNLISILLILEGNERLKLVALRGYLSLGLSCGIVFVLKYIFSRQRPYRQLSAVYTRGKLFKDYSFPSGHTASGFSLATTYLMWYPHLTIPLVLCALVVGISRIYLGQHYPADVFIGGFLGIVSTVLCNDFLLKANFLKFVLNLFLS